MITAAEILRWLTRFTGTAAGTVCAGNDSRLSDSRAPTAHAASHTNATDDIQTATAGQKGVMSAAAMTKLDGIEAAADVTDATNVAAAGAVLEGDTTTAAMSFVIDEDNMASNLATKVPTQQSVKAYVDAAGGSADMAAIQDQLQYLMFRDDAGYTNVNGLVYDGFTDQTGVDDAASTSERYSATGDLYRNDLTGTGAWSDTLTQDTSSAGISYRQILAAATISNSGSLVRVRFEASSAASLSLSHASIVERSGTTDDGTTTPTELTFNGGLSGFSISAGQTIWSDWIVFAVDETKDYLVIFDVSALGGLRYIDTGGSGIYYALASESWNQQTVSYTPVADFTSGINAVEVSSGVVDNLTLISENSTASAEPTTARISLFVNPVDALTLNTDIKAYASRDGGSTYDQITIAKVADLASSVDQLTGEVTLTSTGTTMKWKITTHNAKSCEITGVGLVWF